MEAKCKLRILEKKYQVNKESSKKSQNTIIISK